MIPRWINHLLLILVMSLFAQGCSSAQSYKEQITRCQNEVLEYLDQPSTAEWLNVSTRIEDVTQRAEGFPEGIAKWHYFTGAVRSQNEFGAMLLTNYECTWEFQPTNWAYEEAGWDDGFWLSMWDDGNIKGSGRSVRVTTLYD